MAVTYEDGPAATQGGPPDGDGDRSTGVALIVGLVALLGLFLGVAALVVALGRPEDVVATSGGAAGGTVNGSVALNEFEIAGDLTLPPGEVSLTITNGGAQVHNIEMRIGPKTSNLDPGQSATLDLGQLLVGNYELICTIPGHADSGMTATLTIDEDAPAPDAASAASTDHAAAGHEGDEMDYAAMDKAMEESIAKFPAPPAPPATSPWPPGSGPTAPRSSTSPPRSSTGRSSRARRSRPGPTTTRCRARSSRSPWATGCGSS